MTLLKSIVTTTLMLLVALSSNAYEYKLDKTDGHRIHIVTLDPAEYQAEIAKARSHVFGRATVRDIAERSKAEIAVNAGFFSMGNAADGLPSGTLVIDGKIYGLRFKEHSVLKIDNKGLSIETIKPKVELEVGNRAISINKVNKPINKDEPILYTSAYGSKTQAKRRKEIVFDQSGKMLPAGHALAQDGFIVSLPVDLKVDKNLMRLRFSGIPPAASLVWGIPKLVENGEVYSDAKTGKSGFYKLPHARTAIGIKADGSVVIVVAENHYKKAATAKASTTGLTILELAKLMKHLGSLSAINLDGGGSSTLWIKGKVINKTIGDEDEGRGITMVRAVSDALVFRKQK